MRTRPRLLAIAALISAAVPTTAVATADAHQTAPGIVIGRSIDGIRLGDTKAEVQKRLGKPTSIDALTGTWYFRHQSFVGTVSFGRSNTVVSMWTASARLRTSKGIHASGLGKARGSSLAQVLAAYPKAKCLINYSYGGCTLRSKLRGRPVVTAFTFLGSSQVSEIQINFGTSVD